MSDIHELLDEVKNKSRALTQEIESYKKAKELNEMVTDSLISMNETLRETAEAIKPFTEQRVRKLSNILLGLAALNTLFFTIIVVLLTFMG